MNQLAPRLPDDDRRGRESGWYMRRAVVVRPLSSSGAAHAASLLLAFLAGFGFVLGLLARCWFE